jgi:integrase
VTKDGIRRVWNDVRRRAGLIGSARFRFHDLRHDLATKVLRDSGNLKLTAELLDHSSIATVSKTYAHVSQADKVAALERLAQSRDQNPRTLPRMRKLKAV